MPTVTIHQNALKAVSRFAAIKDVRYYLVGVKIESTPLETRLIATDGHTLAIHRADAKDENIGYFDGIIPAYVIKECLKWKFSKHNHAVLKLDVPEDYRPNGTDQESELRMIKTSGDLISLSFKAIDGQFPDYRRIIPKQSENIMEIAHFNPEYLCRIADAAHDIGLAHVPAITPMGEKGVGFSKIGSDMVAIIMPLRDPCFPNLDDIQWAKLPLNDIHE